MQRYCLLARGVFLISFLLSCYSEGNAFVLSTKTMGTQEVEFTIPKTGRVVVAEIYYPTSRRSYPRSLRERGVWQRQAYVEGAPLALQKKGYPLVIFSHGRQGDRFGNSWIAEALVKEGYIVVMIDHTHNNSYEHSDEFVYTSLWQRPLDLSALLDYLFDHPLWGPKLDKDKVAVGGFSLGGLTALWIAGVEGDAKAFKEAMEPNARWSTWPTSVRKKAKDVDWTQAARSYYDPRVKAVFSIAPDLGKGFKPEGIQQAKVPSLLIVGDLDTITPADKNACFYHAHLKASELLVIKGAEHYTFLNRCSPLGKKVIPHLCQDGAGVDRIRVHKQAEDRIKAFLKKVFS